MDFKKLHLDYETRSVCDLRKCGLNVYASHPTTDIMIASYAFDDLDVYTWRPGMKVPQEIIDHVSGGGQVVAHNAFFEIALTNFVAHPKYGWPKLSITQVSDTMVRAYAMGLPGSLEKVAPAVGLKEVKDMAGNRRMLQMSKPRKGPDPECEWCEGFGYYYELSDDPTTCIHCVTWWDDEERWNGLIKYGIQDVEVERKVDDRLLELSKSETKLWHLDYKINQKGIHVDKEAAEKALSVCELQTKLYNLEMRKISNNAIATCNAANQMKNFVNENGMKTEGIAKAQVADLLADPKCPTLVRDVLKLRQEAGKTSTRKLVTMLGRADEENRIKGILQFLGAHSTGRWAGRGLQVQNFPRPQISQKLIEEVFKVLKSGKSVDEIREEIDILYGPPLQIISSCLRGFICAPPGMKLISCDFSSIESRVLAWLAGEDKKLNIFKGHGKIYEAAARDIYKIPIEKVTKDQRQVGKTAELACGFQGGVKAFQSMAKNLGVKVPDKEAEIIKTNWREANPNIVKYWHKCEMAALRAVGNPGVTYHAGHPKRLIKFKKVGSFLWCQLPSKRSICYPYPTIKKTKTPWGAMKNAVHYKGVDGLTNKWIDKVAYGGLYVENITQATARCLLAAALTRLDECHLQIIMHIHDEIVLEIDNNSPHLSLIEKVMCDLPDWAKDLPVEAEGYVSSRYKK